MYKLLDKLRDKGNLSSCAWRELTDWTIYVDETSQSYRKGMTMKCDTWDSIDKKILRINHTLAKMTIATIKPSIMAATISPSYIDTTLILKYVII